MDVNSKLQMACDDRDSKLKVQSSHMSRQCRFPIKPIYSTEIGGKVRQRYYEVPKANSGTRICGTVTLP